MALASFWKRRSERGVLRQGRLEHLDGHRAAEDGVVGPPDLAHAAAADPAGQEVAAVERDPGFEHVIEANTVTGVPGAGIRRR